MRALCAATLALALAFGFVACGGNDSGPDAGAPQPGLDAKSFIVDACGCGPGDADAPGPDAAMPASDAATPGPDASLPGLDAAQPGPDAAAPGRDAGTTPGADAFVPMNYDAGPTPCSFNTDCPPNERCDDPNFICMIGPRGTGKTGTDQCTNGNDCEGAICAEGWPEGTMYCSGPCGNDAGTCGGQLTVCKDIPFIGVMCIRNLDGGT